jgi:hypothetical protein
MFAGCSGFEAPKTGELFQQPTGSGGLEVGMSKARVVDMYGEPDVKSNVSSSEWKSPREEWFYRGRYSSLPMNAGYLADDMYLYFDGDNLTNISKKPLSSAGEENLGRRR